MPLLQGAAVAKNQIPSPKIQFSGPWQGFAASEWQKGDRSWLLSNRLVVSPEQSSVSGGPG